MVSEPSARENKQFEANSEYLELFLALRNMAGRVLNGVPLKFEDPMAFSRAAIALDLYSGQGIHPSADFAREMLDYMDGDEDPLVVGSKVWSRNERLEDILRRYLGVETTPEEAAENQRKRFMAILVRFDLPDKPN